MNEKNQSIGLRVSPLMHNATFIALIISVITTFLLGILLSETLFNSGLSYFSRLSQETKIRSAGAAQIPAASLAFTNTFKRSWQEGNTKYYEFTVAAKNIGNQPIKKLVFSYDYGPSLLYYVVRQNVQSMLPRDRAFDGLKSLLMPQTAQAQVSIDFPPIAVGGSNYTCTLNTNVTPAECDLSANGGLLKSGGTWQTDLTFKYVGAPLSQRPSIMDRILSWLFGKKAQAQVSIDFPVIPTSTVTTATVVQAVTVNNQTLNEIYTSTASISL